MSIVIVIHIIACIGLIFFILIQSGRGGGLIQSFTSADSIFGTKTNAFITKTTTFFAVTFFLTCLVLAFLSVQQGKSIVQMKVGKQPIGTEEVAEVVEEVTDLTQRAIEGTSEEIPEVVEESIDDILPEQTQIIGQTQEDNAATEEAAAIQ